jgi:hypothetical protein
LSAYREVARDRGFDMSQVDDLEDMAYRALRYYIPKQSVSQQEINKLAGLLQHVYRKGLAAWGTGGHRPGASQRGWADSRVASVLIGGKAAWTADNKQFREFNPKMQSAIVAQIEDVFRALKKQGRHADVSAIKGKIGVL